VIALFAFNSFLREEEGLVETPTMQVEEQQQEEVEVISVDNLIVPDQAGGEEVFIERVLLKTGGQGGYVTVHRAIITMGDIVAEEGYEGEIEDEFYSPGDMIGVSEYLEPGVTQNMIMPLEDGEEVVAGDVILAVLHTDDGDKIFVAENDPVLTDDEGNEIMVSFEILAEEDLSEFDVKL